MCLRRGHSSFGRAPPCQGGGSEFESRCPLQWRHSQVVRQRTANPRLHRFKSGWRLHFSTSRRVCGGLNRFKQNIRSGIEAGTAASAACGGYSERQGVAAVEILRGHPEHSISGTATGHNGAADPPCSGVGRRRIFTIEYTERYRSGHNGAVSKTVGLHGHVGSNPSPAARIGLLF